MTVTEKRELIEQQSKLMQEYKEWEELQAEYPKDTESFKICQHEMQLVDEKAEQIRYILEMRCYE